MPKLHDHLMGSEAVDVGDFSGLFQLIFPHFQTIMLNRLPLKWSARIIDVFLLEGEKLVLDIYQRIYYLSCNKIMQLRTKNVKIFNLGNFSKFVQIAVEKERQFGGYIPVYLNSKSSQHSRLQLKIALILLKISFYFWVFQSFSLNKSKKKLVHDFCLKFLTFDFLRSDSCQYQHVVIRHGLKFFIRRFFGLKFVKKIPNFQKKISKNLPELA